jgi:serine protease Do
MMLLNKSILICLSACALSPLSFGQVPAPQRPRSVILRRPADGGGYLGVGVIELTDDRVKALNLKDDHGVEVRLLQENTPAAKAGLKENDVILEVNSKPIEDVSQFVHAIAATSAGSKISLTVWRNGAKLSLSATLDSRPGNPYFVVPDAPMPPMPPVPAGDDGVFSNLTGNSARVGFEGESLSPQLAAFFGVKQGVLVRTVEPNTPAEKAGLKAGDVVVKVNGTLVTNPHEISGLVRASRSKSVSFTVVRNKKEIALNVQLAAGLGWPSAIPA